MPPANLRFVEARYAWLVQKLPEGLEWLYEVKFDDYRCLLGRDSSTITLGGGEETSSRHGFQSLHMYVSDSHPARYQ